MVNDDFCEGLFVAAKMTRESRTRLDLIRDCFEYEIVLHFSYFCFTVQSNCNMELGTYIVSRANAAWMRDSTSST